MQGKEKIFLPSLAKTICFLVLLHVAPNEVMVHLLPTQISTKVMLTYTMSHFRLTRVLHHLPQWLLHKSWGRFLLDQTWAAPSWHGSMPFTACKVAACQHIIWWRMSKEFDEDDYSA